MRVVFIRKDWGYSLVSKTLNYLLSGGSLRQGMAARLHATVWVRRLFRGRSDVPEMTLLDAIDLRGRVALDVGAHAGNWTFNLSRRVGPAGLVIAYEALPHYGKALSIAMKLLRVKNALVRNVAVGDREATVMLRWRSESNELLTGKTHIDKGSLGGGGVVDVQMVSLDRDLKSLGISTSDVGFIKIDVEGAELNVLKGATNLIATSRPVVYLEAEPQWVGRMGHSVGDIFSEMTKFGYTPHIVSDVGLTPTDLANYLRIYAAKSISNYNNVLFLPSVP